MATFRSQELRDQASTVSASQERPLLEVSPSVDVVSTVEVPPSIELVVPVVPIAEVPHVEIPPSVEVPVVEVSSVGMPPSTEVMLAVCWGCVLGGLRLWTPCV